MYHIVDNDEDETIKASIGRSLEIYSFELVVPTFDIIIGRHVSMDVSLVGGSPKYQSAMGKPCSLKIH